MIDTINKVLEHYSATRITNRIKSALAAITPDDRPRLGHSPAMGRILVQISRPKTMACRRYSSGGSVSSKISRRSLREVQRWRASRSIRSGISSGKKSFAPSTCLTPRELRNVALSFSDHSLVKIWSQHNKRFFDQSEAANLSLCLPDR